MLLVFLGVVSGALKSWSLRVRDGELEMVRKFVFGMTNGCHKTKVLKFFVFLEGCIKTQELRS